MLADARDGLKPFSESPPPVSDPHSFPLSFLSGDRPAVFHLIGFMYFSLARASAFRHFCCDSGDSRIHACAIACAGVSALRAVVVCVRGCVGRCGRAGDGGSDGICVRVRDKDVSNGR